MITFEKVIFLHEQIIAKFGGSTGVRDYSLLESAIQRLFTTFDGVELYPKIEDKASAILESIVKNHPFVDGNKRTGYFLMRYLLLKLGKDIEATEEEKYKFVIEIAEGKIDIENIRNWIKSRIKEN